MQRPRARSVSFAPDDSLVRSLSQESVSTGPWYTFSENRDLQVNELTAHLAQTGEPTRSTAREHPVGDAALRVEYRVLGPDARLPAGLLAAVGFERGAPQSTPSAPLYINVGLQPLVSPAPTEIWWANGAVMNGRFGMVRFTR